LEKEIWANFRYHKIGKQNPGWGPDQEQNQISNNKRMGFIGTLV
jgi:hypothetical protein